MWRRKKRSVGEIVIAVILFIYSLSILVPILHILARSLSDPLKSGSMGGLEIIPKGLTLINYKVIFSNKNLVPSILNSIFITVVGTAINIILTLTSAYVLTRPKLAGRSALMIFFIIMMLFDPGIVPEYMVIKGLGLMGSRWSVILCQAVNVYYMVIMMRYIEAIPPELYEAAQMMVFPLTKAGSATLTMFYAVLRWNEYYRSGIYISKINKVPLQVILRKFVVSGDVTTLIGTQNLLDYNDLAKLDYTALTYATIIVAIIPILIVYPFVLKFYNNDVMAGSVKG